MKTARAYPNIALIKYWGKADEELMLPQTGSLSLTLDIHPTTTTVRVRPGASADRLFLNGSLAGTRATDRISRVLDVVRSVCVAKMKAECEKETPQLPFLDVVSVNDGPTGAGLASSASGFAALVVAAVAEYGVELDTRELSRLARRGSGSATRSVCSGVAVWHEGDDCTSVAESVDAPEMAMVTVVLDNTHKDVTSREGMRRTQETSPFHEAWVASTRQMLPHMLEACAKGDFERIGELTELSALRMHSVIMSAQPPILYLSPESWAVWEYAYQARTRGIPVYATSDAGANVVLLTKPEFAEKVAREASRFGSTQIAGPGRGAHLCDTHLDMDGIIAEAVKNSGELPDGV